MTLQILARVDKDLGATAEMNPEVKQRWLPLCLALQYQPAYEAAHEFVSSQGRMKYIDPVYASLQDNSQHDLAVQWFNENKDFYHPIAVSSLESILFNEIADVDRLAAFTLKVQTHQHNPRFKL